MACPISIKCERCHKSYFVNSEINLKHLNEDQILNLFKFHVDENKQLVCSTCISDQIEIDAEL